MRNKKLLIALFLVVITGFCVWFFLIRRDPVRIVEQVFGVELGGFAPTAKSFHEQWLPNGDGESVIVLKINKFTPEDELYLQSIAKKLPFRESGLIVQPAVPSENLYSEEGYYIYNQSPTDKRNYNLLIFDLKSREIVSAIEVY